MPGGNQINKKHVCVTKLTHKRRQHQKRQQARLRMTQGLESPAETTARITNQHGIYLAQQRALITDGQHESSKDAIYGIAFERDQHRRRALRTNPVANVMRSRKKALLVARQVRNAKKRLMERENQVEMKVEMDVQQNPKTFTRVIGSAPLGQGTTLGGPAVTCQTLLPMQF